MARVVATPATHAAPVAAKSSNTNTMKKWFKYGLAFLAVCLVIAFLGREHMATGAPSSETPKKPESLENPYGNVLYTKGGDDVSPAPGGIGNDLPLGNERT